MMGFIWFWLVAVMIVGYVVLDGFDLGVGVLHLFLVRNDAERRTALASIGPVWDGNEVWLLAGGGTLYFAFPLLYASAFSGFYLPLMIVLWLLILRGVSRRVAQPRGSRSLARAARRTLRLGQRSAHDLLRRRPRQRAARRTVASRRLLLSASVDQLATRTASRHSRLVHGDRRPRGACCSHAPRRSLAHHQDLWRTGTARSPHRHSTLVSARDAHRDQPRRHHHCAPRQPEQLLQLPGNLHRSRSASSRRSSASGSSIATSQPVKAFLSSCLYLFFMLAGACWGLYPTLLPATTGADRDITLSRALSGPHTLAVGLVWWSFGMALAIGYVVFVYSKFRGKVDLHTDVH